MPRTTSKVSLPFSPVGRRTRRKSEGEVLSLVSKAKAADAVAKKAATKMTSKMAGEIGGAIREAHVQLETAASDRDDTFDYMVDLYLSRVPLNLDKRYVSFDARSSRAADTVNRMVAMLSVKPKPIYIPPKRTVEDDEAAAVIQKHLEGYLEWSLRMYGPVHTQALFWQVLVGKSFIQQSYLPAYWDKNELSLRRDEKGEPREKDEEYAERRENYLAYMGPPFMMESIDPRIIWPLRTPRGTIGYIKHYTVERFELRSEFLNFGVRVNWNEDGELFLEQGSSEASLLRGVAGMELPAEEASGASDNVDYYELIDDTDVWYVAGGKVLFHYEHNGGITIREAEGIVTGFKEWALASVGILFAARKEIPQLDFLKTLWFNKAYLDVFPQLTEEISPDAGPINKDEDVWTIEPMTVRQVRGKVTNPLATPETSMDFKAVYQSTVEEVDSVTMPAVGRGMAGSQQSGVAINAQLDTILIAMRDAIDSRARQWGELFSDYLWNIKENVEETVYAFAEKLVNDRMVGEYTMLRPDDIPDYYQVRADVEPKLPIDSQGAMLSWMKAGAEGWATEEEVAIHGFNRTDWREREKQVKRDYARRLMLPELLKEAMALAKVQVQGREAQILGLDKLNELFAAPDAPPAQEGVGPVLPPGQDPALQPSAATGAPVPQAMGLSEGDIGANGVGLGPGGGMMPTVGAASQTTGPQMPNG